MKEEERMGQRTLSTETVSPPPHPSSPGSRREDPQPTAGTERWGTRHLTAVEVLQNHFLMEFLMSPPAQLLLLIILSPPRPPPPPPPQRSETSVSAGPGWIDGSLRGEKLRAKNGNTQQQPVFGLADEHERTWRMREEE